MRISKKPAKKFTTRFRHVANLLHPLIKSLATERGESLGNTTQYIADQLRLSFDTIDSWRRGVRCIPESQIERLVQQLGEVADDKRIIRQLKEARERDEPVRSWKELVEEGHELRVQEARYTG